MPIPLYLIALKLSLINTAILHTQYPVPLLQPVHETTLVFSPVDPLFMPVSMLQTIGPLPRKGCPILFKVNALTLTPALHPLPFVHLTISKYLSPPALRLVILPASLEDRPVLIQLPTSATALVLPPLPVINNALLDRERVPPLVVEGSDELEWPQFAINLSNRLSALLRQILILLVSALYRSIIHENHVHAGLAIYTFASLTVTHLNYYINSLYNQFGSSHSILRKHLSIRVDRSNQ